MRLPVALGIIAAAAFASGLLFGSDTAYASSGTVLFYPNPRYTAWNGDSLSVEIRAQNVATTTQCHTDPNDINSPLAPCGLGAFDVQVSWDSAKLSYVGFAGAFGSFLESTGRSMSCLPPTTAGSPISSARLQCVTLGASPLGPQGSGTLAILTLAPVPSLAWFDTTTPLTFGTVTLTDISGAQFPAVKLDGGVYFGKCVDIAPVPHDGVVDFTDVLAILALFGSEVPPTSPQYDPNGDGVVDLSDALYALSEFGQSCTS